MADRVLLIEDDPELSESLKPHLQGLGFEVDCAFDGKTGLEMALSGAYVIAVLDIGLPQLDGVEVCRRIREKNTQLPILMLSSKADELNKVLLLELGADDYVTKPFSATELKARIKSVLRRSLRAGTADSGSGDIIRCGELTINLSACTAQFSGKELDLTAGEFEVLALLGSDIGHIFSRDEIVAAIHGEVLVGYDAAVATHMNRIRSKIEPDPANPVYLKTARGMGYRLVDPSVK